jgi:hypothetical protein
LSMLADRGYPVPGIRWHGMLDGHWSLVVQTELPGLPLRTLEPAVLDQLLALIELQADPRVESGGWDVSWWLGVVLFEGWEHWWEGTESAAPDTSRRLRAFLEPAWGHRLPVIDLVHGDLNLSNVLAADDAITGVVDWDALGEGSRTVDLAGLLFDWHRLRLARETKVAPDGHDRIVGRILDLAGDQGLRCAVTYGAIARVALTAQRGDAEGLVTWRAVTEAILDLIA